VTPPEKSATEVGVEPEREAERTSVIATRGEADGAARSNGNGQATAEDAASGTDTELSHVPPPWQRVPEDTSAAEQSGVDSLFEPAHAFDTPTVTTGVPGTSQHDYPAPAEYPMPLNHTVDGRPVVTGTAAARLLGTESAHGPGGTETAGPAGAGLGATGAAVGLGAAGLGAPSRATAHLDNATPPSGINLGAAVAGPTVASRPPSALRRPGRGPRRANLQIKRVDPWSVLKLSLVLGVALFLVWLVAVGAMYAVLDGMGVWDKLNGTANDLFRADDGAAEPLISAGRVFGIAALVGAVNIVLFSALSTVGAFVYNVSADLAGGLEVTLAERE